jgi:hypothetical protein
MQAAGTTRIATKRSYGIVTILYLSLLLLVARTGRKKEKEAVSVLGHAILVVVVMEAELLCLLQSQLIIVYGKNV